MCTDADNILQYAGGGLVAEEDELSAASLAAPVLCTAPACVRYERGGQPVAHAIPCVLPEEAGVSTRDLVATTT